MLDSIRYFIEEKLPGSIVSEDANSKPVTLELDSDRLIEVCQLLHESSDYYFDHLASITGIDNGPEVDSMEVIYHLYSISNDQHLAVKVVLSRDVPKVDSLTNIWKAANWHEREAYDLFGIQFENHPDLRRILLPNDWEGYPLRKDYVEQEEYHGVKVKWEKPDNN